MRRASLKTDGVAQHATEARATLLRSLPRLLNATAGAHAAAAGCRRTPPSTSSTRSTSTWPLQWRPHLDENGTHRHLDALANGSGCVLADGVGPVTLCGCGVGVAPTPTHVLTHGDQDKPVAFSPTERRKGGIEANPGLPSHPFLPVMPDYPLLDRSW